VPSVVGRGLASARKLIAASHCAIGKVVHKSTRHARRSVVAQRPAAGALLAPGSKIRLVVSRGR
jgi:beta-lactam-binding protein with PASTA domain